MPRRSVSPLLAAPLALALAACSAAPPGVEIHDPYEGFNRQVHDFNKGLDQAVLGPVGRGAAAAPPILTEPVINFSDNAGLPGTVVNNLLQADLQGAVQNTLRFLVNTTVGVLGLADPAGAVGLTEVEADFGGTLAVWGVPEGAYLELPGLGPSTERDAAGRVVDALIDPLDALGDLPEPMRELAFPARVAELVIERGQRAGLLDEVLYGSADSYAQARLAYLQNRRFELGEAADDATVYFDPYAELP